MKTHTKLRVLLVATVTCRLAIAQTVTSTPPATTPPDTAVPTEEEVMHLSPFEVSSQRDTGYQATQTLAGTRIRTDLKDVGASISVITKQFLSDVGATDNSTLLQYTTDTEVAGPRGTYEGLGNGQSVDESGNLRAPQSAQRVRGLAAADVARDYYITDIPWDSFNVDRIDILRGPNSILYGLGSPAGIVNASLHNPEFRNFGSVEARADNWGTLRGSVDINANILPQVVALRIDGLWNDQKYEQKPAFQNDKRIYGAARFDPKLFADRSWHTSLKVKFEHGEINANRPRTVPPNDSFTPWWRPTAADPATNPYGGAGKTVINNPYNPWRTDNVVAGNGFGVTQSATVNYQPWVSDIANQQQPVWFVDGTTNQLYQVFGGYINNGGRDRTGALTNVSTGLLGKNTNGMFYGLGSLQNVAINYKLPGYQYGQYRAMSLMDPSVFDFYGTLIDGPTKHEWENWNAYNIDFTQTAYDDRYGLELTYDRQKYHNGGEQLLGGSPTITLDFLKNFADFYALGSDGTNNITNPNFGRAYVQGATNNGGRQYYSDREYKRASLYVEVRPSDWTSNKFLLRLLGRQRFNGVAADEKFFSETRAWQMYANSQAWAGYWNNNAGNSSGIADRPPVGVFYLGGSVIGLSSPSGAHIPGITANVGLPDSGVRVFDTTWQNYATNFNTPWTIPSSLALVFRADTPPTYNNVTYDQWYQNSNPANYVGWNSNFQDNLLRYNNGQDNSLLTLAQKALRETTSYSGSYQGYFWNNAFVATLGWRYDEVKTKDVVAQNQPLSRSTLNLQPGVYELPGNWPTNQIVKGHSTSGGAVLHLNNILPRDPLPINISLSYNESSNFQVTSVRRDVYGNPIGNPTGKTYEYGGLLSTKDGRVTLRVVKFTTRVNNTASTLGNVYRIGSTIQQGLRWRNVFLYQLGGYDWASRDQPSYRNTWTQAYPTLTAAQAAAEEDAAITTWNNIQKWLEPKGFFKAWNFNPTQPDSVLVDRTTYAANPSAYSPDPATVYQYTALQGGPQGFSVTADTESKGYEYELTANPLPNWRVSFNASDTTATQKNVGGPALSEFVNYISSQLYNADGSLTPAGKMAQFGNPSFALGPDQWGPFVASYTLLKLQQGARVPELRRWRYNVVTNYTFMRGFMKGVGVGGGYRWQDKVVIGYPVIGGGTVAQYDLSHPFYGPSEDAIDLWASYERKITEKIHWKIQLNVRNAFAKHGLIPISVEPDGHTWATVRVKPVQEWFVTNTFSF